MYETAESKYQNRVASPRPIYAEEACVESPQAPAFEQAAAIRAAVSDLSWMVADLFHDLNTRVGVGGLTAQRDKQASRPQRSGLQGVLTDTAEDVISCGEGLKNLRAYLLG